MNRRTLLAALLGVPALAEQEKQPTLYEEVNALAERAKRERNYDVAATLFFLADAMDKGCTHELAGAAFWTVTEHRKGKK